MSIAKFLILQQSTPNPWTTSTIYWSYVIIIRPSPWTTSTIYWSYTNVLGFYIKENCITPAAYSVHKIKLTYSNTQAGSCIHTYTFMLCTYVIITQYRYIMVAHANYTIRFGHSKMWESKGDFFKYSKSYLQPLSYFFLQLNCLHIVVFRVIKIGKIIIVKRLIR